MPNYEFDSRIDGSNGVPATIIAPVAATQTLVPGDLLVLSSNQLIKATASVAAPFGICAQSSTLAAAATMIRVYPIQPGQIWKATSSADATSVVLGANLFDITNTAAQTVDVADATNGSMLILRLGPVVTVVYVSFVKGYFWV